MSLPATLPPEPTEDAVPERAPVDRPRLSWKLFARAGAGLVGLIILGGLLGWLLRGPIEWAGTGFIDLFGLGGLGVLTLLVDASPLPLTNEPLMVLAIGADVGLWAIFGVMSAGSTLAGVVGWIGGRIIGQHTAPGRWLMLRYPAVQLFLVRWGALGVAIAALTPIPFGLTAWAAGMARVPFWKVALASVARVPKTGFYLWLIAQGWALGG